MTDKLLSMGREAIVFREGDIATKSYRPDSHPLFGEAHQKIYGHSDFQARGYTVEVRDRFFHRERALLEALASLTPQMVPRYIGSDARRLEIRMEYVTDRTYQEAILANLIGASEATEEMVIQLAQFHLLANANLPELQRAARVGPQTILRQQRPDEEVVRLLKKFQAIIYYGSEEFGEYLKKNVGDADETDPERIRLHVRNFLGSRRINVHKKVKKMVSWNRELLGEEAAFFWGEAKPQNMFYRPGSEHPLIIDFPRTRVGPGSYSDLVSLIYNTDRPSPFSPDEEVRSVKMAGEYFRRVGVPASEQPSRHARLLGARLMDTLRELANYCQKEPEEVKRQLGRKDGNGEIKQKFLERMFATAQAFVGYYRFREGDGWAGLMEGSSQPTEREKFLVRRLFETAEETLKVGGVLTGKIASPKRVERLSRLIAPEYSL